MHGRFGPEFSGDQQGALLLLAAAALPPMRSPRVKDNVAPHPPRALQRDRYQKARRQRKLLKIERLLSEPLLQKMPAPACFIVATFDTTFETSTTHIGHPPDCMRNNAQP